MFHSKSLILPFLIGCAAAQSYTTNFGSSGSYSSFSLGGQTTGFGHPPKPAAAAYKPAPAPAYRPAPAPAPAYRPAPAPSSGYQQSAPASGYQQPAPASGYHQPAPASGYQQPAPASGYQQPAPASGYQQPAPANYGEKCVIDYTEEYAEVCVPSLKTNCEQEEVTNGLRLVEEEQCFKVTRTICTEDEEVVQTEVCAVAYRFQQVVAEAKLVDVKWEKSCREEKYCPPTKPGYAPPQQYCKEHIKKVCYQNPVLYPVTQPVTLKLPQPVDTCIVKEIALPRIKCTQVSEQRCNLVPKLVPGDTIAVDKCTTSLGEDICRETPVKLPRQACYEKVKKVVTVYEDVEPEQPQTSYTG